MKLLLAAALCFASGVEGIIAGKAAETMDAGGYTYVRVEQGASSTWVAVPKMKVKAGEAVSFKDGVVMTDFQSPTLKRKFERIVFSEGPAGAPAKIEKASGGGSRSVAELYARRAALAGTTASVRGKVVKVNRAIMDRNWVHLQDGSVDAKGRGLDLLVTTKDDAKVGDVVTATGSVAQDQDFGMGYKYEVMLEKATLKR